jgi:hypothetical protein
MVQNVDRNMQQLLNKTNVNNSIDLFFIMLTTRIPQIMIHSRKTIVVYLGNLTKHIR